MAEDNWAEVDRFIADLFVSDDPVLAETMRASEAAGLPAIEVSPPHGRLLMLLAKAIGARRILEIGTLAGYSSICLARALPEDGRLITLEADAKHAGIAKKNIDRAGLGNLIDIRVGRALDTLPRIEAEGIGPFDLIFIDADKPNNPSYFAWALRLARRGSLIVVDNVIRYGALADEASKDANANGARNFMEVVAAEKRVMATAIQTVGVKGHDGFAIALVTGE